MACDMVATVSARLTCDMTSLFKLPEETRTNLLRTLFAPALKTPASDIGVYNYRYGQGFSLSARGASIIYDHETQQLSANGLNQAMADRFQAIATALLPQIAGVATQLLLAQMVQANFKTLAQTATPTGAIAMTIEV